MRDYSRDSSLRVTYRNIFMLPSALRVNTGRSREGDRPPVCVCVSVTCVVHDACRHTKQRRRGCVDGRKGHAPWLVGAYPPGPFAETLMPSCLQKKGSDVELK